MLVDFYQAAATVSFTLLGLWWVVVQARRSEWRDKPGHRRAAFAISLQFALPGLMSLLSLVEPSSGTVWRLSFGSGACAGIVALVFLRAGTGTGLPHATSLRLAFGVALALYASIALVAIGAGPLRDAGAEPQQVAAVLAGVLFFVGVCVAWVLFDE